MAVLLAAAILLAGCGGSEEDDRKAVEQTVIDYFVAFSADDRDRACDRLSTTARDQLIQQTREKDCPAAVAKARQDPGIKQYLPALAKIKVEKVEIEGATAKAEVQGLGAASSVPLVKEGDDWKIGALGEPGEE